MADTENKVEPVKLFCSINAPKDSNEDLPPIIFIPGLFSTNRSFIGVKYEIARRTKRKVYAIELRNHGKSGRSSEFSLPHLVADLENFMVTEDISKAVIAGHSMGGKVALGMALKHPEKVEMVIVEDIPLVYNADQLQQFIKISHLIKLLQMKLRQVPNYFTEKQAQTTLIPYVDKFWPKATKNFNNTNTQFALPFYKNNKGEFEWEMDIDVITERIMNDQDKLEIDLSSNPVYPGKVLLLAGEKSDIRVQDDLSAFYKHFPQFECRIIENGFHTYHAESPQLYSNLVSKFIGEDTS